MRSLPLDQQATCMALSFCMRSLRPDLQIQALSLYLYEVLGPGDFGATEVARPGVAASGGIVNEMPPPELWANIVPTIRVAQWLRDQLKRPLRVNSGYRCPPYNRAVGGSSGSLHTRFNALDLATPPGSSPGAMYKLLQGHPDASTLGLGLYPWGVHVDTRGLLGLPVWRSAG